MGVNRDETAIRKDEAEFVVGIFFEVRFEFRGLHVLVGDSSWTELQQSGPRMMLHKGTASRAPSTGAAR
jgi:hypothetical protein